MTRAGLWAGVAASTVVLVGVFGWAILRRSPPYEGDPAVLARNEADAVRAVLDLARRGVATSEREAAGYLTRAFGTRAYAWPLVRGVTGVRTYAADAEGHVAWTNDPRYAGAGRGPLEDAAFAPDVATWARRRIGPDGNEWRLLHN